MKIFLLPDFFLGKETLKLLHSGNLHGWKVSANHDLTLIRVFVRDVLFSQYYILYAEAGQTETETNVWECSADGLQSVASVSVNTAYSLHTLHQQYSLGIRY